MLLPKIEPRRDRQERWARESGAAWAAHHAEIQSREENMLRLKALRLAKQASDLEAAPQLPSVKKRKSLSKPTQSKERAKKVLHESKLQRETAAGGV